jgi:hypothetical protein
MDILSLPLYSSLDRIEVAISGMQNARSAGIAIQYEDRFRIATAGMLLFARPSGVATLGDLSTRSMLGAHVLTSPEIVRFGLDAAQPLSVSPKQLAVLFGEVEEDFVVIGAAANFATIVTRADAFAKELSTLADCYCTGPRQHGYPEFGRPPNNRCYKCGALIVCNT